MINRRTLLAGSAVAALLSATPLPAKARRVVGAAKPWTTYPGARMKTTGTVIGPAYGPYRIEMESTRQRCLKLLPGDTATFTVRDRANAMIIRYSLPDSDDGQGIAGSIRLSCNGNLLRQVPVTSKYAWLYGDYPFTNDPKDGQPRHFYDEVRLSGLSLKKGDVITLQNPPGGAPYCIIDLVDLENAAPPARRPVDSLSAIDFGADPGGERDSTEGVRACVAAAAAQRRIAWVPAGRYRLTGDIVLPSDVTLMGAGMWHTTFVGDEDLYGQADRRLRFKLTGNNIHLADFALIGRLKYRNDSEQNDGIFGVHASQSSVKRIWVEHTKVGMWFYVCRAIAVEGCRLRNTMADGINLCVDTRDSTIENCSARGTGDDCFAIWPSPGDQGFRQETPKPGNNVICRCTGELNFLAQGGSIYGGANNRIEDCLFRDIASGCGILISTTFPTSDANVDNNFSGTTLVRNCEIVRCGGYDHGWAWRAAFEICLDRRDISGLRIADVRIKDSLSDGFAIMASGEPRTLSDCAVDGMTVPNCGIGSPDRHGLHVKGNVDGRLAVSNSRFVDVRNESARFEIASTTLPSSPT